MVTAPLQPCTLATTIPAKQYNHLYQLHCNGCTSSIVLRYLGHWISPTRGIDPWHVAHQADFVGSKCATATSVQSAWTPFSAYPCMPPTFFSTTAQVDLEGPVATHMKCCRAHLNSCPTSTKTIKNPIPLGGGGRAKWKNCGEIAENCGKMRNCGKLWKIADLNSPPLLGSLFGARAPQPAHLATVVGPYGPPICSRAVAMGKPPRKGVGFRHIASKHPFGGRNVQR